MGKIVGKCSRCSTCCENFQIIMPGGEIVREWLEAHEVPIVQESGGFIEFRIPYRCPHLKDDGCDLHGENKPLICREYPDSMPEFWLSKGLDPNKSMGDRCGFRWV